MVPTLSPIYGQVIDLVVADHLDVVGQFPRADDPHADSLPSGSRFEEQRLQRVWLGVKNEIAAAGAARDDG